MNDNDIVGDFDAFDLLQEHDLLIRRLVKANVSTHEFVKALYDQNQQLTNALINTNKRLDALEHQLRKSNSIQ